MIRVRLLSQVTAAGAALAALPMMAGCASTHDDGTTGTMADTAISAGTGTVTFYNWTNQYKSTSSGGDEFIRVGERMTSVIQFSDVVHLLDDSNAAVTLESDPSTVKVTLQITYTQADDTTSVALYPVTFAAGVGGIMTGTSAEYVVPSKVKAMTLDYIAEFKDKDGTAQKKQLLSQFGLTQPMTVFGAFAPDKLALFDTIGSTERVRVVEGGDVVAGHNLTLTYTDYRLDGQVDKTSLDLRYGQQKSYSRFGSIEVDALGTLDYQVAAAISTDGGATFHQVALLKNVNAEVIAGMGGRYAYEKTVAIPDDAGPNVQVAFHIQAFLDVPNYADGTIDNPKYAPGQRVLLKDVWDNAGGGNYELPVGQE